MAKRGRPPLPREVKAARGTLNSTRERRADEAARAAAVGIDYVPVPPPPDDLQPLEREVWERLAPQLDSIGTYAVSDHDAFRLLVTVTAAFEEVRRSPVPLSGAASTLATLASRISNLHTRFGLDPASRVRVPSVHAQEAATKTDPDEFAAPGLKIVS